MNNPPICAELPLWVKPANRKRYPPTAAEATKRARRLATLTRRDFNFTMEAAIPIARAAMKIPSVPWYIATGPGPADSSAETPPPNPFTGPDGNDANRFTKSPVQAWTESSTRLPSSVRGLSEGLSAMHSVSMPTSSHLGVCDLNVRVFALVNHRIANSEPSLVSQELGGFEALPFRFGQAPELGHEDKVKEELYRRLPR
jgi:hypothetical protein